MKKIIILAAVLIFASCQKAEMPVQPPCSVTSISKSAGKITLKLVITTKFLGNIYVENPFVFSAPKMYNIGTLDTVILNAGITKNSYIVIDYRKGHLIR